MVILTTQQSMLNFLTAALIVYEIWRIQHHCTATDSNKLAGVIFGTVAIFGLSAHCLVSSIPWSSGSRFVTAAHFGFQKLFLPFARFRRLVLDQNDSRRFPNFLRHQWSIISYTAVCYVDSFPPQHVSDPNNLNTAAWWSLRAICTLNTLVPQAHVVTCIQTMHIPNSCKRNFYQWIVVIYDIDPARTGAWCGSNPSRDSSYASPPPWFYRRTSVCTCIAFVELA